MQGVVQIWIVLGLVGVVVYLARTGYLAAFISEQVLPMFFLSSEDDLGSMLIGFVIHFLLTLISLLIRNLLLWVLAVILGPFAIVLALVIRPEKALRVITVDLESDSHLEASDIFSHYVVGRHARQCSQCGSLTPLDACPACGSLVYGPAMPAIRCRKCHEYIDRWTCPGCNTVNKTSISLIELRPYLVSRGH